MNWAARAVTLTRDSNMTFGKPATASLWLGLALACHSGAGAAESVAVEVLEEGSRLEAKVSATLHSFSARVTDFKAEIELDAAGREVRLARLSFRVDEVDTGNKGRNAEMLKWLGAEDHPQVSFELQKSATVDERRRATGDLRMAGVVREIKFPFELVREDDEVTISGSYRLDHRDWDLPVVRKFFLKVDPELEVQFELRGKLPSGEGTARKLNAGGAKSE